MNVYEPQTPFVLFLFCVPTVLSCALWHFSCTILYFHIRNGCKSFSLLYTTRSLFSLLPTPLAKVSRSASYRRLCALLTLGATFSNAA